MTAVAIDLHNHMPVPDADYRGPADTSGQDVVNAARAAGIRVLGISDHFSLAFFREAHAAAEGTLLSVLPGTEVRLAFGDDEVHLVALFPVEDAEARFGALMEHVGFRECERTAPLHRVVVEHDPVSAAAAVISLGGICVVAHVDRHFGEYRLLGRTILKRLVDEVPGIVLEFVNSGAVTFLGDGFAGVPIVRGSDSHHVDEIGRRRTVLEVDHVTFEGIRAALGAGAYSLGLAC